MNQHTNTGCNPFVAYCKGENPTRSDVEAAYFANPNLRVRREDCIAVDSDARREAACSMAFGNHFHPLPLVRVLAAANDDPTIPRNCFRKGWPTSKWTDTSKADVRTALKHSICTIWLRDPITRAVSHFYQYVHGNHPSQTTLTADEFLDTHGPAAFVNVTGGEFQFEWVGTADLWSAALELCIVGLTERPDEWASTLSRIIRAPSSTRRKKLHSNTKKRRVFFFLSKYTCETSPLL